MKFTTISAVIASAMNIAIASADLHNFCACGIRFGGNTVQDPYVCNLVVDPPLVSNTNEF